jgi:hypothetical protein
MIEMTREADRDLEVDVLALQALSSPSDLAGNEVGMGATCVLLSVCCITGGGCGITCLLLSLFVQ